MILLDLGLRTLRNPREGLRAVLDLGLPPWAGLAAVALTAVGSALLLHLSLQLQPLVPANPAVTLLVGSPFRAALIQAVILLAMAGLMFRLGRAWGGAGRLDEALVTVAWFQAFFVVLQALQLVAGVTFPSFSGLIGILSIVLFFWLLTQFTMELHGFRSAVAVFLAIVAVIVAMSFLSAFLMILALGPESFVDV